MLAMWVELAMALPLAVRVPDGQLQPKGGVPVQGGHGVCACRPVHVEAHVRLVHRHRLIYVAVLLGN